MRRIIILILILLTIWNISSAYYYSQNYLNGNLTLSIDKGDSVRMTLSSYLYTLKTAKIIWYLDDKEVEAGIGLTEISITKPIKPVSLISVGIGLNDGRSEIINSVLYNDAVSVVYENISGYKPYWYQGRTLASEGSTIRLWAISNMYNDDGKPVPSNQMYYEWRMNGLEIPRKSGQGRNYIDIEVPLISLEELRGEVRVTNINNDQNISQEWSVPIAKTEVNLYAMKNGIYKYLSDSKYVKDNDWTLYIEPFYFNKNINPLSYSVSISGKSEELSRPYKNIKINGSYLGSIDIFADVNNPVKILQSNSKSVKLNIDTTKPL